MLRKMSDRNKKYFAVLTVLFVLICSFLGCESDFAPDHADRVPIGQSTLISQTPEFEEILCTQETFASQSPAAFLRQLSSRKHSTGSFAVNAYVHCIPPVLAVAFLFFIRLHRNCACSTHRCIIGYIHNKDGQKA